MTEFAYLDPSLIYVDREDRQRRKLEKIEELASSIMAIGQLQPIVIDRQNRLIAGERRLAAVRFAGLPSIKVQYYDDLDDFTRHLIELEENVKREDLIWQDRVRAMERGHQLLRARMGEDWTVNQTARHLQTDEETVRHYLLVASALSVPEIAEQKVYSTALNMALRRKDRESAREMRSLSKELDAVLSPTPAGASVSAQPLPPTPEPKAPAAEIRTDDFLRWKEEYRGPAFNMIHCDFPYGKNTGDKVGQSAAKGWGTYADDFETYDRLLTAFCEGGPWLDPSAHLIFWFAFDFYELTRDRLREAGWTVNGRPLIWHKTDNTGILPDPNRGPRWGYETALFASRGDRKIVRAVSNIFGCAGGGRELHTSEKPRALLEHFFRMTVDEFSRVLDPTCGSGNAVQAGLLAGAEFSLGLEINPQFALTAREALETKMLLRS